MSAPHAFTEQQSRIELESTEVGPRTARLLVWAFLALCAAVPLAETAFELSAGRAPLWLAFLEPLRRGALVELVNPSRLRRTELALERGSRLRTAVQPRLQEMLVSRLGFGNHIVLRAGQRGLLYAPGVAYVTGRPLLEPAHLEARAREARDRWLQSDPQPDPRPAILRFHHDLQRRGIHLLLLPVPDKAMDDGTGFRHDNPDHARLAGELRAAGVDLLDLASEPALAPPPRFLPLDTHWTPAYMQAVAARTAEVLRARVALPAPRAERYRIEPVEVPAPRDLVDLLGLPPGQRSFPAASITVERVLGPDGAVVAADPGAAVLLLGDSFAGVYAPAGAGFPQHLARALGLPVDLIALDGEGATGTRRELARPEHLARLAGKQAVVWEFAIRELAVGDWQPLPLAIPPRPATPPAPEPAGGAALRVTGRLTALSRVPAPYTAPYDDCLVAVSLEVESIEAGEESSATLLVFFEAMRDNVWLEPARFSPGQRLALDLVPLRQAAPELRSMQRADDLEDYEHAPYLALRWRRLP